MNNHVKIAFGVALLSCLMSACSLPGTGEHYLSEQSNLDTSDRKKALLDEILVDKFEHSSAEGDLDELSTEADSGVSATVILADPQTQSTIPLIWDVFRENVSLNLAEDNQRIKVQRDWYSRNQAYITRVLTRAEPYIYHILDETVERNLPSELALLPIVESAFDPFAYSHGRAAGIWQFIPGTGKAYGLKQTWWYEGRRDPVASTEAALNYLERLNKQFDGDWMLALASYNSGAGTVRRAIRRNKAAGKPTDFWSLDLPKETRAYVPKLIALSQIFFEPKKYNVTLLEYPFEPYFDIVETGAQLDLALAADMAELELDELYRLNPGFNRWATDPDGPHRILVPIERSEKFRAALDKLPPEKRIQWIRYTIQEGDSVLSISKKNNLTPELLMQVNHLNGTTIRAGKTLLIPTASQALDKYSLSADQRLANKLNRERNGKQKLYHRVSAGDSFWSISREYEVDHRSLASWNGMAPTDLLAEGRNLVIYTESGQNTSALQQQRLRKVFYKARNGDSYARIADRFNISLRQIKSWNNVNLKKYLQPGDTLTLYVDVANAP